jgi:thiol:disulfide interchange protein
MSKATLRTFGGALLLAALAWLLVAAAWAGVPPGTRADMFLESSYAVVVDTFADRQQVRPGEEFTLAVRITPFENDEIKFHIYGAEPIEDWSYVPSVMMADEAEDVEWSDAVFPPGEEHDGQMWLSGQPVVTVTGTLTDDVAAGLHTFTAQLMFSACTEEMCLMPSLIELSWEIEVVPVDYAGEIPVLSHDELFAPVEVDYSRFNLPELEGELGGGLDLGGNEDTTAPAAGDGVNLSNLQVSAGTDMPIWQILLFALLGGLILNVMPCVLPVVSIKVIDLVGSTGKEPREIIGHGLTFAIGIIATFLLGAVVIAAIQGFGTQLGWGSQFQSPGFVLAMSTIMFVFGLSLIDVFKIKATETVTSGAGALAKQEGYSGSFFKGVLATLLGTPCVGPFLGPALIVAFTLTWMHTLLIFLFVGLGMALPYLVMLPFLSKLSKRDRGRLSRKLQGSTGWLNDFKVVMAFLLFATVIYLLYILEGVLGGKAVIWALMFLTGVAFASWLWARLTNLGKRFVALAWIVALLVTALSGWFAIPRVYASTNVMAAGATVMHSGWEMFSVEKLEEYTAQGQTVLVDFTAAWCPNCKTNEAVALNIASTQELKEELGIVFLIADWTARDDEIQDVLLKLGFASVPLTAIFPGGNPNAPILLDGVFTPARLHDAMREAAGVE